MTTTLASAHIVARYVRWMRAKGSPPSTVRTIYHTLHLLSEHLRKSLLSATEQDLADWQIARSEQGVAASTLRTNIGYIRAFYRWAQLQGEIDRDPTVAFAAPRVRRYVPRPISEERLDELLRSSDEHTAAILALAAFAGLRAMEIAKLRWSDVEMDGPSPHLRVRGKGGHEAVVPISPKLSDYLAALPSHRGPVIRRLDGKPGHNTENNISGYANRFMRKCGIPDTLHALRHRFGTMVYRHGRDLRATQEALRHSSPAVTAVYAQVEQQAIRDAVDDAGRLHLDGGAQAG